MTKFTNFVRCSANCLKHKKGRVAEWLGKALQKLLQRFESAPDLKAKEKTFAFFDMIRYSKWISLAALILLVAACFMPWAYYGDLGMSFTGFFTEKNSYGKPAKLLLIFGGLTTLFSFTKLIWLKRSALLLGGLCAAYAVKNFLLFGSCYRGYCPEKQIGLYLMLISALVIFLASLFPEGRVNRNEKRST